MPGIPTEPPPPPHGDIKELGPAEKATLIRSESPVSINEQLSKNIELDQGIDMAGDDKNSVPKAIPKGDSIQVDTEKKQEGQVPTPPPVDTSVANAVSDTPQSAMTSVSGEGGGKKFTILIVFLSIIAALIWVGVAYLYYSNTQMTNSSIDEVIEVTPPPAPSKPSDEIQISNGSVVRLSSATNEEEMLVDKGNFEGTGITGFISVIVSPDEKLMCFSSISPAPAPAMYVASVDGSAVTQVNSNSSGCVWSSDSNSIAFLNNTTDLSAVDVFKYDIATQEVTNLTEDAVSIGTIRRYDLPSWSSSDTLVATYTDTAGLVETKGISTITISTGEIVDIENDLVTEEVSSSAEVKLTPSPTPSSSI